MTLGAYLKAATATRWKAGEHDCSAWPARWAGVPLPAYETDEEADVIVAEAGGLVALWERTIGDRLPPVEVAEAGDVGIIEAGERLVGAIFTGDRWAFLTPRRVMFAPCVPVAAWRVECPRP